MLEAVSYHPNTQSKTLHLLSSNVGSYILQSVIFHPNISAKTLAVIAEDQLKVLLDDTHDYYKVFAEVILQDIAENPKTPTYILKKLVEARATLLKKK